MALTILGPILRRLTSVKIYVFAILAKSMRNKPRNVYMYLASDIRAFQNRFDHVYTTILYDSTIAQLGPVI